MEPDKRKEHLKEKKEKKEKSEEEERARRGKNKKTIGEKKRKIELIRNKKDKIRSDKI